MKEPLAKLIFSDGNVCLLYIRKIEVTRARIDITDYRFMPHRGLVLGAHSELTLEADVLMPPTFRVWYPKSLTDHFTLARFIPKLTTEYEDEEPSYDPAG